MCFYFGADIFVAARPQVAGGAPSHTSCAASGPGGRAEGSNMAALPCTHQAWGLDF